MKITTINELKSIYTEVEKTFDEKRSEMGMDAWDDEMFDEFRDETDEFGYSKHITCDEIWTIIDYAAVNSISQVTFTYNNTEYEFEYNIEIQYLKMLFVNMLWCLWELQEKITLNGKDIHEINREIDF